MAIHKFESVAALGRAVDAIKDEARTKRIGGVSGNSGLNLKEWTGETFQESIASAINGNTDRVAEAEQLLDRLQTSIEVKTRQWSSAVAGAFPCVPDYLIGHPESMRQLDDASSDTAPLRVFVCTSSTMSMTWEHLKQRGVAILAATMALCQSRPVELWTFTALKGDGDHGECNVLVRINASPLCLSEACVALCSVGYDRNLCMAWGYANDSYDGKYARGVRDNLGNEADCTAACRRLLDADEDDLVIPPSSSDFTKITSDPVGWVQKIINQYTANES